MQPEEGRLIRDAFLSEVIMMACGAHALQVYDGGEGKVWRGRKREENRGRMNDCQE